MDSSKNRLSSIFVIVPALLFVVGTGVLVMGQADTLGYLSMLGVAKRLPQYPPKPTVLLPALFHKQEHALSCEAATLKMALSVFGADVSESEILKYLPYDKTPKKNGVWGDPNKGFVGKVDGVGFVDGYGVHWEPIAKVGLRWKRTEILYDVSPSELAAHLDDGRPIITWGYGGNDKPVTWKTLEGKVIKTYRGEHVRLLVGYAGKSSNPDGFFVLDPLYGMRYWDRETFLKQINSFDRTVVVVYKYPRWIRTADDRTIWEISKDGETRRAVYMTQQEFKNAGGYAESVQIVTPEQLERFALEKQMEI